MLIESERKLFMDELKKISEEIKVDERSNTKDVHEFFSDEVAYLRELRFDMIETCAKLKDTGSEFD